MRRTPPHRDTHNAFRRPPSAGPQPRERAERASPAKARAPAARSHASTADRNPPHPAGASPVLDDERPRLDGGGIAPAGIAAAVSAVPITLDGGGRVTAIGDMEFEYDGAGLASKIGQASDPYPYLFGHDALGRLVGYTTTDPDIYQRQQGFFAYEDIFGSNIAVAFGEYIGAKGEPPPPRGTIATHWRAIYDGIDQPLTGWSRYVVDLYYHYELDCVGNVRRLRAAFDNPPNGYGIEWAAGADFGGYRYTAFGQQYPSDSSTPYPAVEPGGEHIVQRLRWQSHYLLYSYNHEEIYDFRTRLWSPSLGAFLQPDGFGRITPTGTLWSWPGQNPMRWRDPYGEGPREEAIALGAVLGADVGMVLGGGTGIAAGLASGGVGFGTTPWLAAGGGGLGAVAGGILGGAIYDTSQLLGGLLDRAWMVSRSGAGKNEAHGDAGRALEQAEEKIAELEEQLAELKRTQGSRAQKNQIEQLIKNLRRTAEQKRKGETHGRRGKGCR